MRSALVCRPGSGLIETHGIEIEVPTGWTVTNKGTNTTIMPTKYKGRGIDVTEVSKPPTKELIEEFAKAAKMKVTKLAELARNGTKTIVVEGSIDVKGKGEVGVGMLAVENASHATTIMLSFVKADTDPVLVKANDQLLLSARLAGPKIALSITKPKKAGLVGIPDDLAVEIGAVGTVLDKLFRFPRPLPIKIQECGVVNAFYQPDAHQIIVCHEFWDDTLARFKAKNDDKKANQLARGAVMFAFLHETGHALVGEFNLPITGRGEDAADEVATLILASSGDEGKRDAIAGMEWFEALLASHNNPPFWDEHSMNDQRLASVLCLLYGSDQKTWAPVLERLKYTKARAGKCVRDYGARRNSWKSLLKPHTRPKQ
ncbi:hypothetical protein BH11MYX1_BH11MYX1_17430 [soil metagenome]